LEIARLFCFFALAQRTLKKGNERAASAGGKMPVDAPPIPPDSQGNSGIRAKSKNVGKSGVAVIENAMPGN
jgi:hypothetical protein